jgi:acetyltransferase-like isoleucine patch superfamily enzyme
MYRCSSAGFVRTLGIALFLPLFGPQSAHASLVANDFHVSIIPQSGVGSVVIGPTATVGPGVEFVVTQTLGTSLLVTHNIDFFDDGLDIVTTSTGTGGGSSSIGFIFTRVDAADVIAGFEKTSGLNAISNETYTEDSVSFDLGFFTSPSEPRTTSVSILTTQTPTAPSRLFSGVVGEIVETGVLGPLFPGDDFSALVNFDLDPPPVGTQFYVPGSSGTLFNYAVGGTAHLQLGDVLLQGTIEQVSVMNDHNYLLTGGVPWDLWLLQVGFPPDPGDDYQLRLGFSLVDRSGTATALSDASFQIPNDLSGFNVSTFSLFKYPEDPPGSGQYPVPAAIPFIASGAINQLTAVVDGDNDGIEETLDNCPTVANADQANSDGHPAGDACVPPGAIPSGVDVGANPVIGAGTKISMGVSIGDNANIGSAVNINKNIEVGDDVSIGDSTTLNQNVVVGNNVTIGSNVVVAKNVVIDDGVTIGDAVIINQGSHICPDASIGSSITIGKNRLVNTGVVIPPGSSAPLPAACTPPAAP